MHNICIDFEAAFIWALSSTVAPPASSNAVFSIPLASVTSTLLLCNTHAQTQTGIILVSSYIDRMLISRPHTVRGIHNIVCRRRANDIWDIYCPYKDTTQYFFIFENQRNICGNFGPKVLSRRFHRQEVVTIIVFISRKHRWQLKILMVTQSIAANQIHGESVINTWRKLKNCLFKLMSMNGHLLRKSMSIIVIPISLPQNGHRIYQIDLILWLYALLLLIK